MVLGMAGIFGGNATDTGAAATAAVQTPQNPAKSPVTAASSFAPMLREVIQGTGAKGQKAAMLAKTVATTDANSSLVLVPGLPPVAVPTTPPATTPTPTPTTTPTTGGALSTAIEILTAQLVQDGIDVSQIQMVENDQLVTVPGAPSYENNQIVINVNGRTHSYSSDLTMQYPQITANLIQQFVAGNDV